MLAVVKAAGVGIEGANEFDAGLRLLGCHVGRAGQVFHIAFQQQLKVRVDNQRRHLHGAAALVQLGLGLGSKTAVRVFLRIGGLAGIHLVELMLLGGDLDQQTLAQIAGANSSGIEMLNQVNGAADQVKGGRELRAVAVRCGEVAAGILFEGSFFQTLRFDGIDFVGAILCGGVVREGDSGRVDEGRGELFVAGGNVAAFVQVTDYELDRLMEAEFEGQSSQLPRQVIGQSGRLGEKIFKRGLLVVVKLRLCTVAGVEIILEVRAEVDLGEDVLRRSRGLLHTSFQLLLAAGDLIQHRNGFIDLLQDGIFHHLGIDHLLQFHLIQCKNAHHLHQARSEDLSLRDFQVQSWLQQRHRWRLVSRMDSV